MTRLTPRLLIVTALFACCTVSWAQFTEAAGKIRDAVVTVAVANRTGTGFLVNSDGNLLTNKHVIGDAKAVTVKLRNGDQLTAQVVKSAADRDICLLKVDRQHLPTVQFAASAQVKQGDNVAAIGAPFGLEGSLTRGVVSATDRDIKGQKFIQIDAALNQGNSGGPVINEDGQIIGMATKAAKEAQSVGFAIPSDELMAFLGEAGIAYQAALGATPKTAATATPAPTPSPAEATPALTPGPSLPAPPNPLAAPWVLLVAAAGVSFIVALVTALLVAGKKAVAVVPQPAPYSYAPPTAPTQPYAAPQPPVRPAAPPAQEDLSDIDIELR